MKIQPLTTVTLYAEPEEWGLIDPLTEEIADCINPLPGNGLHVYNKL